jgi:hypothetical protein
MTNSIHQMKLHEEIKLSNNYYVLRVSGGWIYTTIYAGEISSTFVPYNCEFEITIDESKGF